MDASLADTGGIGVDADARVRRFAAGGRAAGFTDGPLSAGRLGCEDAAAVSVLNHRAPRRHAGDTHFALQGRRRGRRARDASRCRPEVDLAALGHVRNAEPGLESLGQERQHGIERIDLRAAVRNGCAVLADRGTQSPRRLRADD